MVQKHKLLFLFIIHILPSQSDLSYPILKATYLRVVLEVPLYQENLDYIVKNKMHNII